MAQSKEHPLHWKVALGTIGGVWAVLVFLIANMEGINSFLDANNYQKIKLTPLMIVLILTVSGLVIAVFFLVKALLDSEKMRAASIAEIDDMRAQKFRMFIPPADEGVPVYTSRIVIENLSSYRIDGVVLRIGAICDSKNRRLYTDTLPALVKSGFSIPGKSLEAITIAEHRYGEKPSTILDYISFNKQAPPETDIRFENDFVSVMLDEGGPVRVILEVSSEKTTEQHSYFLEKEGRTFTATEAPKP